MADEDDGNSLVSIVYKHASFFLSVLGGFIVFLLLTSREVSASNILFGWNASAIFFIGLSWRKMLRATVESIRKRSEDLDFSDTFLLFLSIAAALASIAGIGIELHSIKDAPANGWREFVCIEAANAGEDVIHLAPGRSHTLAQRVGAT